MMDLVFGLIVVGFDCLAGVLGGFAVCLVVNAWLFVFVMWLCVGVFGIYCSCVCFGCILICLLVWLAGWFGYWLVI